MAWDPAQYLAFAAPRLRPAQDLLARVAAEAPAHVFDLGCGAGNVTELLRRRWAEARIVGVDSSAEMLAAAAVRLPDAVWLRADLAGWSPPGAADVIFSNAALHWLDDHAGLFPRLLGHLAPGGSLAVQMPRNHGAPSHTCLVEAAREGPWAKRLEPLLRPSPVAPPALYHELLAPLCRRLEIWESEYLHVLEGRDPVVAWVKGSALKPLLDALEDPERKAFEAAYTRRIRQAYPPAADGRTLFPFRRLFIVAER